MSQDLFMNADMPWKYVLPMRTFYYCYIPLSWQNQTFLAVQWLSVYFILHCNCLIVPFLRVFLFLDFSQRKQKQMSGSLNTLHFSKAFPGKMQSFLPASQTCWCFVLPRVYLILIPCLFLTSPSLIADSLRKGTVSCQTWCVPEL